MELCALQEVAPPSADQLRIPTRARFHAHHAHTKLLIHMQHSLPDGTSPCALLPRCTPLYAHPHPHPPTHRLLCATPSGGDRDDALIVDARAGTVRWLAGGTAQRAFSVAGHILAAAWATIGYQAHRCVCECACVRVCVRVSSEPCVRFPGF